MKILKKKSFVILLVLFAGLNGATAENGRGATLVECPKVDAYFTAGDGCIDVGCRPSVGECLNSCADHRAIAKRDRQCEAREVRCYCRTGSGFTNW